MSDFETLAKSISQVSEFARTLQPSIAKMAAEAERVGRQMEHFAKLVAPQVLEAVQSFAEAIKQMEKADREVFALLAPRGWLISPSAAAGASLDIYSAIEEHGIEAVELELIAAYSPAKCEEILINCLQRRSFARWQAKLLAALEAHKNGKYELAIPIWLMAVEGILSDELSNQERIVQKIFSQGKTRIVKGALSSTKAYHSYLDALIEVINTFGRQAGPNQERIPVLSRHAIMHGQDPDFGSEKDSIQCIILLEVVHMLLEDAERRST